MSIESIFWSPNRLQKTHQTPAEDKHSENPPWVSGYLAPNERPQQRRHCISSSPKFKKSQHCVQYWRHDSFILPHVPPKSLQVRLYTFQIRSRIAGSASFSTTKSYQLQVSDHSVQIIQWTLLEVWGECILAGRIWDDHPKYEGIYHRNKSNTPPKFPTTLSNFKVSHAQRKIHPAHGTR